MKKFRSDNRRRRHLKLDVIVCVACHRTHAHFLSATFGLEDGSIMDVDIHGDHVVCDAATQTDFDLFDSETTALATAMPSSIIKKGLLVTNFETDSIRLPFFRISNSHNRCPTCKKFLLIVIILPQIYVTPFVQQHLLIIIYLFLKIHVIAQLIWMLTISNYQLLIRLENAMKILV